MYWKANDYLRRTRLRAVPYVSVLHETGKAMLIDFGFDSGGHVWLPLSQITVHYDQAIDMPHWLAEEKGLVEKEEPW